ncbi:MAG: GMC family oxidoreductase [Bacteroidetes bacterium]|nr:GMC family oxidoreductase [Bacteroidota bacterium]MBU1718832.1 GMC family oxidoreductase [Bacteroidota bacterium]
MDNSRSYIDHKYIVIGSGCSGAMAAQTLVDSGVDVGMLDVGFTGNGEELHIPDADFVTARTSDASQHKYLIGSAFDGISFGQVESGSQLTPPRKHLIHRADELIPIDSAEFKPTESLAIGGLGSGWGLGCYVYNEKEAELCGLNFTEIEAAYKEISGRIGISAAHDDDNAKHLLGGITNTLGPLDTDNSVVKVIQKYKKRRAYFQKRHATFGRPAMAMLSTNFAGREATRYDDFDFYTDRHKSAYRPCITIDALRTKPNFAYHNDILVLAFSEVDCRVRVEFVNVKTSARGFAFCDKLLICAGALGTARIVLRSASEQLTELPVLCNSYSYLTCINKAMKGKALDQRKTSMAQAMLIYDEGGKGTDIVTCSLYTYRSLLMQRTIGSVPLNLKNGRKIMRDLLPAVVLAGIHHPDNAEGEKKLSLEKCDNSVSGDRLSVIFRPTEKAKSDRKIREKQIRRFLRKLGCTPVMRIDPGYGSSIHYAGTVPFSDSEATGTCQRTGRLNGYNNVFVADSSPFRFLPAKGITLSIMAFAHLVAKKSLESES